MSFEQIKASHERHATTAQRAVLTDLLVRAEWIDPVRKGSDRIGLQFRPLCRAIGQIDPPLFDPPTVDRWLDELTFEQAFNAIRHMQRELED